MLVDGLKMKTAVDDERGRGLDDAARRQLRDVPGENRAQRARSHPLLARTPRTFTPIFNKIEGEKPDVIITGISHVGVQPTVQWKSQQVPIPMFGVASQATNSTFWKDTNGATEGVIVPGGVRVRASR